MDKVLVEVFVPVIEEHYDVRLPVFSKIGEVVQLLSAVVEKASNEKYHKDSSAVLCDADSGEAFSINMSVYEAGIKNGSKLMLM